MKNIIKGDKGAAEFLNVTLSTVQNWRRSGIIPFAKIGGKIYYDAGKLKDLVKNDTKMVYKEKGVYKYKK